MGSTGRRFPEKHLRETAVVVFLRETLRRSARAVDRTGFLRASATADESDHHGDPRRSDVVLRGAAKPPSPLTSTLQPSDPHGEQSAYLAVVPSRPAPAEAIAAHGPLTFRREDRPAPTNRRCPDRAILVDGDALNSRKGRLGRP